MTLTADQRRAIAAIDYEAMATLLARLVDTPSPTGAERAAADVIADYLSSTSVELDVQAFAEGRANVIGQLRGSGSGPTLMLNGHLDTSYTGEESELSGSGYKNRSVLVDDEWMYGNGVHNMKSAVAAFAEVVASVDRSGVPLSGNIVFAAVAGEIEKSPFGRFQGPSYDGFGVGTAFALRNGLTADMCILGEPTALTIGLSNLGILWIRLSVRGTMAHTQHASEAVNAIDRARWLMDGLDRWMRDYRDRHEYKGLRPAADITAIEGGWPYRLSRTPIFCDVFVCLRLPPTTTPTAVVSELRAYLTTIESEVGSVDLDVYVSHPAAAIEADEPVVAAIHRSHLEILRTEPVYRPRGAYMDSSHLVAYGIPTVVYGPSGRIRTAHPDAGWSPDLGEHTSLTDLRTFARIITATVVDLCSTR